MATLKQYKCESCGYERLVSPSPDGHEYTLTCDLYHFMCKKCRDIIDILNAYDDEPERPVCPYCGSEDLESWNVVTGKCPKCGGKLTFDETTGMVLLAD